MTTKPKKIKNEIYAWQSDKYFPLYTTIKPMEGYQDRNEIYNPEINAQNIARLFMYSLPGNTLDSLLTSIADDIRVMLNSPEQIDILKSAYDIENRIRGTLDKLAFMPIDK